MNDEKDNHPGRCASSLKTKDRRRSFRKSQPIRRSLTIQTFRNRRKPGILYRDQCGRTHRGLTHFPLHHRETERRCPLYFLGYFVHILDYRGNK
ncbi:hypothetical protein BDV11DRAFT_73320 [Aspergillus similis]